MSNVSAEKTAGKGKNGSKAAADRGEEWDELPEPTIVEGWFVMEEDAKIEGVILERDEGQFGGLYKIKISKPCKAKDRDGERMYKAGSIIGVNENAKLRQLSKLMKKEPISVQIHVTGERPNGRGWDMTVKHRPAF